MESPAFNAPTYTVWNHQLREFYHTEKGL